VFPTPRQRAERGVDAGLAASAENFPAERNAVDAGPLSGGSQMIPVDVSIVIPTFRRPRELAEALASVLFQEDISLEVIVVDDSPEQAARAVVGQIADPRIRYLANPAPSSGSASVVRNYGVRFAAGRFVHFLDDDDKVPPGHYAVMIDAFETHPEIGVVFGRVEPFGDDAQMLAREHAYFAGASRRAAVAQRLGGRRALSTRLFFDRALFVCGAAMIRRRCIEPSAGFDPDLRIAEDVDFYARAIRRHGGYFVDHVALLYRIWHGSIMHTPTLDPAEVRDSYRKIHARFRSENGDISYFLSKVLTRTLFRLV
jgi:GT2 family glycosyltransferase